MRERTYINVSGAAINCNKTGSFFQINAPQYTSQYKNNRTLSILPVHTHFNSSKYRSKKPIPLNNTYISIEGFLDNVETDSSGHATSFHISVDNINFLSKATLSPSTSGNTGKSFKSLFIFLLITITQRQCPPCRRSHHTLNSTLTSLLQAHPPKPPFLIRFPRCLSLNTVY